MGINLGIIGAGSIAAVHAEAARRAGSHVVAICDVEGERAQALADRHGHPASAMSLDDLLSRRDVSAVVVAVPNHLHKDIAIRALQAGKHILLEKPMAMNVGECDEIIRAVEQAQTVAQMGFVCRQSPTSRAAMKMIESGALGRISHIKASLYRRRGIPGLGKWFTTRALSGGGVLVDIGVHLIDLAMYLSKSKRAARVSGTCASAFGSPIDEYVYLDMWAGPPHSAGVFDVEDSAHALIRFDNGITLELAVAWAMNVPRGLYPDGMSILGDRGGISFDIWGHRFTHTTELQGMLVDSQAETFSGDAWNDAWMRQHERFAASVETGLPPAATIHEGRAVQAILDAIYESHALGQEVVVL